MHEFILLADGLNELFERFVITGSYSYKYNEIKSRINLVTMSN